MALKVDLKSSQNGASGINGLGAPAAAPDKVEDTTKVAQNGIALANAGSLAAKPLSTVPVQNGAVQTKSFDQTVRQMAKACGYSDHEISEGIQQVKIGDKIVVIYFFMHEGDTFKKFDEFWQKQALSKRCVYMTEAILRDPAFEKQYVKKQWNKDDTGFYYGLEDEVSHARHTLFSFYDFLRSPSEAVYLNLLYSLLLVASKNPTLAKLIQEHAGQKSATGRVAERLVRLHSLEKEASGKEAAKILHQLGVDGFVSLLIALLKGAFADAPQDLQTKLDRLLNENSVLLQISMTEDFQNLVNLSSEEAIQRILTRGQKIRDDCLEALRAERDPLYGRQILKMVANPPHQNIVIFMGKNHKAGVLSALREQSAEKKSDSTDRKDGDKKA